MLTSSSPGSRMGRVLAGDTVSDPVDDGADSALDVRRSLEVPDEDGRSFTSTETSSGFTRPGSYPGILFSDLRTYRMETVLDINIMLKPCLDCNLEYCSAGCASKEWRPAFHIHNLLEPCLDNY